jgi:transcriptional regulator with XRE-family HTH domain
MARKLIHYLRNERRIAGYTQADIAALLGVPWKTRVARYERGAVPPIDLALAYEVIFGKPAAELLAGKRERVEADVRRRARELLAGNSKANTPRRQRRERSLERIAA